MTLDFSALNGHAVAVLCLTGIALVLFTQKRIPIETTGLVVLVALTILFAWFPYPAGDKPFNPIHLFAGFGHEALISVCALMIVGYGLERTGALEPVGRQLGRLWGMAPRTAMLITLLIAATLSAFMNNTPIVVLLLPILVSVSVRNRHSASAVLLPMGFATLLGGMTTAIGTSTNLLVVSIARDLGAAQLGMFDFFVPAVIAAGGGIVYLWLVAPLITPERETALIDTSPRIFTAHLHIPEDSFADGKSLAEVLKRTDGQMTVKRVRRSQHSFILPLPDVVVRAGDHLVVSDTPDHLKAYERALDARLFAGENPVDEENPLTEPDQQLAEIVVIQGSELDRITVKRARILDEHQLVTLAIHRAGRLMESIPRCIADTLLQAGDVLLVQGNREQLARTKREGRLLVLDATTDLPRTSRAPFALAIMAAVVLTAAFGLLPISISATAGVLLMILTGCLDWRNAAEGLSTPIILIVVASLALGTAMEVTGGTRFLAESFLSAFAGASPRVILSGMIALMAVLTNIVSNNAAAVIGTPIAIDIASRLGLPVEPFILAVLFGANLSFATPMAYKTNLLVMSAGGYRFSDFVRVGLPLAVLAWLILSYLLPTLYGF